MVDSTNHKLHVVIFPWLAFGHINPYLELSKFIAQKGHKVSFVSTTRNVDRLPNLPSINFVKLTLPKIEGLPENAEATMDVICTHDIHFLKKAFDGLEPEFTRFLETASPDWVVYDFAAYWVPPLAMKLGISCAFFSIISSCFIAFIAGSTEAMINGSDERGKPDDWTVPPKWVPFPSKVGYRTFESNFIIESRSQQVSGTVSDLYRVGMAISGSDIVLIRDCTEFEPEWLGLLQELHQKPIIPVGLMPPSGPLSDYYNIATWLPIKEWLDSKHKGSIAYVALGSEVTMSQGQMTELALGLELSGLSFIWALRKSRRFDLPHGFLERTYGRGFVCTSWAPQLKILSHESVGGFLTHCGWSSVVEGLTFGHPLIMLPFMVDQGLNARLLANKKVGIEVPRNELDGSFTRIGVAESLRLIMVDDDQGRNYKEKAKEMSAMFGDKELHNRYIDNIITYLEANGGIHASS